MSVPLVSGLTIIRNGVRANPDYFTTYYPRQFLARFEGTQPAVMRGRMNDWPQGEGLALCVFNGTLKSQSG